MLNFTQAEHNGEASGWSEVELAGTVDIHISCATLFQQFKPRHCSHMIRRPNESQPQSRFLPFKRALMKASRRPYKLPDYPQTTHRLPTDNPQTTHRQPTDNPQTTHRKPTSRRYPFSMAVPIGADYNQPLCREGDMAFFAFETHLLVKILSQ